MTGTITYPYPGLTLLVTKKYSCKYDQLFPLIWPTATCRTSLAEQRFNFLNPVYINVVFHYIDVIMGVMASQIIKSPACVFRGGRHRAHYMVTVMDYLIQNYPTITTF